MNDLNKILTMCIEKGLFFNFSPHVKQVSVYNENMSFNYYSYYEGELSDLNSDGQRKKIDDLIKLIKKQKSCGKNLDMD